MPRAKKATAAAAETVAEQADATSTELATTEAPEQQLVAIEDISLQNAPTIFGQGGLAAYVEHARKSVIGEVPDLTTDKGRKRVASLAAGVARSKTALDGIGRDYLRALKSLPKVIEAELREFNTDMDALRDEVRAPLNAWEKARDDAAAAVQAAIDNIIACYSLPDDYSAADIRERITWLEEDEPTVEVFGERLEEAQLKLKHGLKLLQDLLPVIEQKEAEAAELEQLRREKAEREQQERDEKIAREAREKAQKDLEDEARLANERAAKAEKDAEDAKLKAAQDIKDAQAEAQRKADQAVQDERDRAAQALEDERLANEQRAADEEHRGAINSDAVDALVEFANLTKDQAKDVVRAIVRQQVPNVSIFY